MRKGAGGGSAAPLLPLLVLGARGCLPPAGWLVCVKMNCFHGPVNGAGACRTAPAAAFQSVAVAPFWGPGALCTAPHRWLISLLAAPVGGSTQGPRLLTGP